MEEAKHPSIPTYEDPNGQETLSSLKDMGHEAKESGISEDPGKAPDPRLSSKPESESLPPNKMDDVNEIKVKSAVNKADWEGLRALLDADQALVLQNFGGPGDPPLHYIIRSNRGSRLKSHRSQIVRQFVEYASSLSGDPEARAREIVRATGQSRRPALHCACQRGFLEIATYLLEMGAEVDAIDYHGDTALLYAVSHAETSHREIIRFLLRSGADPNFISRGGSRRTALHKAANRKEAEDFVDLLLSVEADVDPVDCHGETPLHDAADCGLQHAVEKLLEGGAKVDKPSRKNWTPLHMAANKGHEAAVKTLLMYGASPNSLTRDKNNALSLALRNGHEKVVELLKNPESLREAYLGRSLEISRLNGDQKRLCSQFTAVLWPKIGNRVSVMELLYSDQEKKTEQAEPLLKQLTDPNKATWIHLPANNRIWVEDLFKLRYKSLDFTTTTTGNRAKSKGKEKAPLQSPNTENVLRQILLFIEEQYNESNPVTGLRQPHFRSAAGPRSKDDRMFSIVLPVIDTDMQQPWFYDPNMGSEENEQTEENAEDADERMALRVKEYTISEGLPLNEDEKTHVSRMQALEKAYKPIHFARTLDESFHEILSQKALNYRNGDQVISRYLARLRVQEEDEKMEGTAQAASHRQTDGSVTEKQKTGKQTHRSQRARDPLINGDRSTRLAAVSNDTLTLSQLESQEHTTEAVSESTKLRVREWIAGNCLRSREREEPYMRNNLSTNPVQSSSAASLSEAEIYQEDTDDEHNDEASKLGADDEDDREEMGLQQEVPRQQLLVVPQLWLWKIENLIVTAYPDKWDSSEIVTLPQTMIDNLERRSALRSMRALSDMGVDELLSDLIDAVLEFEALFKVPGGKRNYHDAFAGEIAFVSGQVAHSYAEYRKVLGKSGDSFAQGMRQETEYLVMADDILSELAMIKRVEQDQNLVGSALRHQLTAMARQTPEVAAKLDRQMEDAMRLRNSIVTLLDLRQRQATTENALSSGRQSEILFAQSKVLFIFTAATVLFAPLSWTSSLMALKIDDFTPNSWSQGGSFAAFFISIVITILLCVIGWQVNNKYVLKDRVALATR